MIRKFLLENIVFILIVGLFSWIFLLSDVITAVVLTFLIISGMVIGLCALFKLLDKFGKVG